MGGFVDARGLKTWYEEYGSGRPLVMLHGDAYNAEAFSRQVPAFRTQYRLFVPERRGHGRTEDVPGDYTYDVAANDTIAFIEALGLEDIFLLGHSGGADVAIRVAATRPDLVAGLIPISGESSIRLTQEQRTRALGQTTDDFGKWASFVVESYYRVTPDGERRFPAFFEKIKKMWATDWEVKDDELAKVTAPTMIMLGDHDFGTVEESAALSRKFPKGQLCVVPGAGHGLMWERPEVVNALILDFLKEN